MTQEEKIKRLEELFKEIEMLFPKGFTTLMVHGIDMDKLNHKEWLIEGAITEQGKRFWTAEKNKLMGLVIFD